MEQMTLGSLFDGIGGWQLAGVRNGIKPVWSSEIETFPLEVTKRRFPETKQLGDVTKINGAEIEPCTIITSGSPCQDLSTAGTREGLEGSRSGLFFDAIRIIREMRVSTGNVYPRFYIFENVPGTLSSNQGMDFRTILESITESEIPIPRSGRWANAGLVRSRRCDVGWRIIDAQYLRSTEGNFLLPQRRRRLWIVTDFAESGRCAEKILFEQDGLCRNSQEVREKRPSAASTVEKSIRTTNRVLNEGGNTIVKIRSGKDDGTAGKGALIGCEQSFALSCTNDQFLFQEDKPRKIYDTTFDSEARETEVSPTLQARMGTGGNQVPILIEDVQSCVYDVNANNVKPIDVSRTLDTSFRQCCGKQNGQVAVHCFEDLSSNNNKQENKIYALEGNGARPPHQGNGYSDKGVMFTLNTVEQHGVACCMMDNVVGSLCSVDYKGPGNQYVEQNKLVCAVDVRNFTEGAINGTLQSIGASSLHANTIARIGMCVRRLTPTECERLQSLPDGWTLIDHKSCTDAARYKALGNGMAQNVPDWILRRLVDVLGGCNDTIS